MNKLRNLLVGMGLIGSLASTGCENPNPVQKAVVVNESFYPQISINSFDRYTALLKLENGQEGYLELTNNKAREFDLKYNPGDTVMVRKANYGNNHYDIVDNLKK